MSIITVPPIIYPAARATDGANIALDASEEFLAFVLPIPKTGTLNKIGWRTGGITGSSYTLKISVETVATTVGQPVATTNSSKTLYTTNAESADITNLSANTIYYTPLNGSTGISVTAGDLVSVTFRLTAVSSSTVNIRYYSGNAGGDLIMTSGVSNIPYTATYLGSAWTQYQVTSFLVFEYSDGFAPSPASIPPIIGNALTYNSGSTNNYIGVKFSYPFKCRLLGCHINVDLDGDANLILYNSDEYSIFSGFPISLLNTKRASTSQRNFIINFQTKPELEANNSYRLILAPTSATNIILANSTTASDGSYSGLDTFFEGDRFVLTQRLGAPSSGGHSWTDSTTDKPSITLLIDGIDTGSGSGGGTLIGVSSLIS